MTPQLLYFCFVIVWAAHGDMEVREHTTYEACKRMQHAIELAPFFGPFGIGMEKGVSECYAIPR